MTTSPVTAITDELLAEIEAEASMATGRKWEAVDSPVGEIYIEGECNEFITGAIDHVHDANFIALASPGTVLAIIAELRSLRADLKTARADEMQAMRWLSDIRAAAGMDGCPKIPELVEHVAGLAKDAARYRWLRMTDWWDSPMSVIVNPKQQAKPGTDCPSRDRLDSAIDAAMQEQPQ